MNKLLILAIVFVFSFPVFADSPEKMVALLDNEFKLNLNESGTAWTKLTVASQFWGRYSELNPGTVNKAGDLIDSETEIALRRTRFIVNNNLDDQVVLYLQFGFNNLTSNAYSLKPQIYLHDAWAMFRILPQSFYIGLGLNGWNGLSRLSNTSFLKTVTLDNPGVNYPNINQADLEYRQLGIFAKGTWNRLSYRTAVAKPFVCNGIPAVPLANTGYEYPSAKMVYKGYFTWHFLDREYFNTSYVDMTYLGKKRILNLGAGFDINRKAVAEFDVAGNRTLKDRKLSAVDFMLEMPMLNNRTISVYSVVYQYDFGANFMRASGTMNNWSGGTGVQGAGNNEYKAGTGSVFYSTSAICLVKSFWRFPDVCSYIMRSLKKILKHYRQPYGIMILE